MKNLKIVDRMRPIGEKYGKPLAAVAIRFILDHLGESVVLCGAKRADQIISNAAAADWRLSEEDMSDLEKISRE